MAFKALTALIFAQKKFGVSQTASVRSPYIYAEDNWVDDMELTFAIIQNIFNQEQRVITDKVEVIPEAKEAKKDFSFADSAFSYAKKETVTPWLGADTAKHYQWYPFINIGHYELAKQLKGRQ